MMDRPLVQSEDADFKKLMKFRRYFTTHPNPAFRKNFRGRLESISFGDVVFDDAVATVKNAINARLEANWSTLKAADGINGIHFDYVESDESNAFAFYVNDLACVAITDVAIRMVLQIAERLAISKEIKELLRIPTDRDINQLVGTLFVTIMQVLSNHEMGHIFHGHCIETARILPLLEATESEAPCFSHNIDNTMRRQAMEVEADGYGVHMFLNNIFGETMGKSLAEYAGTTLPLEEFLLTFAMIAYGGMFYLWAAKAFQEDRVEHCEHPFGLMRMNVIMTDINGWCEQHRPTLVGWGNLYKFQVIMEAIASTELRMLTRDIWKRQGAFLLSPKGQAYRDRLYAKQRVVREEMKPHRWYLLSELQ